MRLDQRQELLYHEVFPFASRLHFELVNMLDDHTSSYMYLGGFVVLRLQFRCPLFHQVGQLSHYCFRLLLMVKVCKDLLHHNLEIPRASQYFASRSCL